MHFISLTTLLSLLHITSATIHTGCYNYFKEKDGCVNAAADARNRCSAKTIKSPAHIFEPKGSKQKRNVHQLEKRYDAYDPAFYVASPKSPSDGICGPYDTVKDAGVCLWSGGWVTGEKTSNCQNRVYVNRKGSKEKPIYANVIDGCDFNMKTNETGCFQIGLTLKVFLALKPSSTENATGSIPDLYWGFDNDNGQHSQQAPV